MRALRRPSFLLAFLVAALATTVTTAVAQRTSNWTGGSGNWFGPNDTCSSWDTCTLPGTNPGESGFTDNVFINTPGSAVTVNGGVRIANLTMGSSDTLTTIDSSYVEFDGSGSATLSNAGTINLTGVSGITAVGIPSPSILTLTMTGGGVINMQNVNSQIAGSDANFINQETIEGQGFILASGTITNQGIVNANTSGALLVVQPGGAGLTNSGTLEASNGGILNLRSGFITIPFDNTGGTIEALDGSTVLNQAGIITGGTLTTSGTGIIQTVGANPTLQNLTNAGTYQILPGGDTTLVGAINNTGSLLVGSTTGGSQLIINGPVTLSGSGTVTMVDSTNATNTITSFTPGSQLTNQQTIQGTGSIGDNDLTILNQGTILANSAAHPLGLFDAGFTNQGTVQATNGATLNIFSLTFDNQGTLRVDAGSTVNFSGSSNLSNYNPAVNTLTGGSYVVAGTIQFTNAGHGIVAIDTNAANITLTGASSQILDALNNNALAGLSTNAGGGSFTIENGRNFTTAGDFQNSGTLVVGSGSTFTTGSGAANNYTQSGASSLTDIAGQLSTSSYTLNAGTVRVETGGTLTWTTSFNFNGGTVVSDGTLDPASLTVCASCNLAGTGTVAANVTSSGFVTPGDPPASPGKLSITGGYTQNAGGTLVIDLGGTGAGQFGVLNVSGNASLDGLVDFVAINGFTPTAGDDFAFLLFGSESGDFRNIEMTGWSCPVSLSCVDVFSGNTLSLEISGTPTPEPSGILSLGIALLCLAPYFRKRVTAAGRG